MSILYVSCDTLCMMNHSLDHFIIMTPNLLGADSRSSIQVTGWPAHVMRLFGWNAWFRDNTSSAAEWRVHNSEKYAVCFMLVCQFLTHGWAAEGYSFLKHIPDLPLCPRGLKSFSFTHFPPEKITTWIYLFSFSCMKDLNMHILQMRSKTTCVPLQLIKA